MKRISLLLLTLIIPVQLIFSQEESVFDRKTKRDPSAFIPEKGDWAIGISATPFFMYAGNLFSQSGNAYAPGFQFTAQYPGSIYLKYKKSAYTTLRTILTIGSSFSQDKILNNDPDNDTPHTYNTSALSLGFIFGIEKNKSVIGRLSAFYGWQAGILKSPYSNGSLTGKIKYTNQNDAEQSFEEYGGNTFSFSAGGFGGLEFYILPRVAFSGEVGLGLKAYKEYERYSKQGSDDAQVIDNGGLGVNLTPIASGEIAIFIYF
jgi:hypothetical protein